MGAGRHRKAFTWYSPGRMYFWAGILLCVTFGLVLAGLSEAYLTRAWGWLAFFVASETVLIVLYVANVRWWLRWMNQTDDYKDAYKTVVYEYERPHHEHPGEHRHP